MKKIRIAVFVLAILIPTGFLLFKKFSKHSEKSQSLNTEFSTNSVINIDKRNYECNFSHFSGKTKIDLIKPDSIKGLSIEWADESQKISIDDLTKSGIAFSEDSFLNLVVKILDNLNSLQISKVKDDGRYQTYSGKVENSEFEITSERSKILEIYIKSKNARINFD